MSGDDRRLGTALRVTLIGFVLVVAALVVRWGEDVTAPVLNVGEAEMAGTVAFESDGGTYRIVTSGPTRPPIFATVCDVQGGDGDTERTRGSDGLDGGHQRFGVTRVEVLSIAAGPARVTCGNVRPTGGAGNGRFQIVAGDGPVATAVTVGLVIGVTLLVGGVAGLFWTIRGQAATGTRGGDGDG